MRIGPPPRFGVHLNEHWIVWNSVETLKCLGMRVIGNDTPVVFNAGCVEMGTPDVEKQSFRRWRHMCRNATGCSMTAQIVP